MNWSQYILNKTIEGLDLRWLITSNFGLPVEVPVEEKVAMRLVKGLV